MKLSINALFGLGDSEEN